MGNEQTKLAEQISALEAAIAARRERGGVASESMSVNGGSKSISYESLASMEASLDALRRRYAAIATHGAAARCYYPFGGG